MAVIRSPRSVRLLVASLVVCVGASCTESEAVSDSFASTSMSSSTTFNEAFRIVDTISLEESDSVINVTPFVSHTASGQFIIADAGENQIRIYNRSGELVQALGRKGQGPVEFANLRAALSIPGGRIVALERSGRIHLIDAPKKKSIRTEQLPVSPLYEASVLNDSTLMLVGRFSTDSGTSTPSLIGLADLETFEIRQTFFKVPRGGDWAVEAQHFGHASAAAKGDTIAAVYAMADTVYFFETDGTPLGRQQIQSEHFRPLTAHVRFGSGPAELSEWLSSFSMFIEIHWGPEYLLLQYVDGVGPDRIYSLVTVDRQGNRLFEISNAPRFLTGLNESLFFVDPNSEVPNQWVHVH